MGLHDRTYWKEDDQGGGDGGGGGGLRGGFLGGMPKPTKIIKYLLIINLAVFMLQVIFEMSAGIHLSQFFGMTLDGWWQPWRYITFQFLHSPGSLIHLGFNMLGLYMLGTPLAQYWGDKKFLRFYLACGVGAGIAYVIMAQFMKLDSGTPLIGASGGVVGIILACAVLFPHFKLIMVLFPVPIRLAALIIFGAMAFDVVRRGPGDPWFWSQIAHSGGAIVAALWMWVLPILSSSIQSGRARAGEGAWKRKMQKRHAVQHEIDAILDKIQEKGINSLSDKEKRKLQEATDKQKKDDRGLHNL